MADESKKFPTSPDYIILHDSVGGGPYLNRYNSAVGNKGVEAGVGPDQMAEHSSSWNPIAYGVARITPDSDKGDVVLTQQQKENLAREVVKYAKSNGKIIPRSNIFTHYEAGPDATNEKHPLNPKLSTKNPKEAAWKNEVLDEIVNNSSKYGLTPDELKKFTAAPDPNKPNPLDVAKEKAQSISKIREQYTKETGKGFDWQTASPEVRQKITEVVTGSPRSKTRSFVMQDSTQNSTSSNANSDSQQKKSNQTTLTTNKESIKINSKGEIDPVSFARRAEQIIANSKLNGFVPVDGEKFGIKTGSPKEWARFYTMITQQESGMRVNETNPDGSLKKFKSTPSGEASYGPGQFNIGQYGLNTWADVNNPEKVIEAYIKQADKYLTSVKPEEAYISKKVGPGSSLPNYRGWTGISAYFGSVQRPNETLQHSDWFDKTVSPTIGEVQKIPQETKTDATKIPTLEQAKEEFLSKNKVIQHTGNIAQATQEQFKAWYRDTYLGGDQAAASQVFEGIKFESDGMPVVAGAEKVQDAQKIGSTDEKYFGTLIKGYDPNTKYKGYKGRVSEDYVNKNFLPAMEFVAELGLPGAIGENPYVKDGKIIPEGTAPIAGHSSRGHHYGAHGALAADISTDWGGTIRPEFVKSIPKAESRGEIIRAFGDLMFHPDIVKKIKPTEMINQNRRVAASGGWQQTKFSRSPHPNHVHFSPGKGITKEKYDEILKTLFNNPDAYGKEGRAFVDIMVKHNLYIKNENGTYGLNPEKFPRNIVNENDKVENQQSATPISKETDISARQDTAPLKVEERGLVDYAGLPRKSEEEKTQAATEETSKRVSGASPQTPPAGSSADQTPTGETKDATAMEQAPPVPPERKNQVPSSGESAENIKRTAAGGVEGAGTGAIQSGEAKAENLKTQPAPDKKDKDSNPAKGTDIDRHNRGTQPNFRNNPESRPSAKGSPGFGSYGRCFV